MSKVLITGATGQLGQAFQKVAGRYSEFEFLFVDRSTFDIENNQQISDFIKNNPIDFLINCAAYTASDKAEEESERAHRINADAVKQLALLSQENSFRLITFSSDYVFDGKQNTPYLENTLTEPLNVYGQSKVAGENAVLNHTANGVVLRVAWIYSSFAKNFVKTILHHAQNKKELRVVYDQVGTPTYAETIADTVLKMLPKLDNTTPEIYHLSDLGVASWYDLAHEAVAMMGIDCNIIPILSDEYPSNVMRPAYSVMDKTKIQRDFNIELPYWRDSLRECIDEIKARGIN
ncbi:dTDP-4-dehydrorhamnose reductase [Sulfurimonas diazotrophicus]|uniref:dTDP-4-dehydrorhamnose reductase n=1 Tax=Sulfurimonas diazotrophicus TaxID=3131939 RepID=A0ABZ3H9Q9_9BACT